MAMSVHFRPPTNAHQNFQIITPYIVIIPGLRFYKDIYGK